MRTRLEISGIPNQPIGYKVALILDDRPHLIGVHEELFMTEGRVKLSGYNEYENHMIQALTYNKYQLKVVKSESFRVEMIKYAKSVRVISGEVILIAKITAINLEEVEGSSYSNAVIEFYDVSPANYDNGTYVQNYLRSDIIEDNYLVNKLKLSIGDDVFYYYTLREPEPFSTSVEESTINVGGLDVQTSASIKQFKKITFYLNNEELQEFMYNVPICDGINNRATLISSGLPIEIIERPTYEFSIISGAIDLYKVTLNFVYKVRKEYNYGL